MKHLYFFGFFLILPLVPGIRAIPRMRVAPLECPLQDGNLLDVGLFAQSEEECKELCAANAQCIFYHFYDGLDNNDRALEDNNVLDEGSQSAQCFLYDDCNRQVLPATEDCPLTR